MKYFTGMLTVLGGLVLALLIYMTLHALCMKIAEKIEQRRKLKTIEGKIGKINNLIKDILYMEPNQNIIGKAYNPERDTWLCLHELSKVELSDKN